MPESSTIETSNRPNDPAVEAAEAGRFVRKKETGRRKRHQRHREQQQQAPPPIGAEVIGAYSMILLVLGLVTKVILDWAKVILDWAMP
jgi:hypothetical protein